jgi:hypothetical protein
VKAIRSGGILVATGVVALGAASVWTHASSKTHAAATTDTGDVIRPADSFSIGTSSNVTLTIPAGGFTVTCTHNVFVLKTPSLSATSGPTQGFRILPPTFDDGIASTGIPQRCSDNSGATNAITTAGTWRASFVDGSNDAEPGIDTVRLTIPIDGGSIWLQNGVCMVTIAPQAAFSFTASYNDGLGTLSLDVTDLPIKVLGGPSCPTAASTAALKGTYSFKPRLSDT